MVRSEDCYCSLFCAKLYGKNWVRLTLSRFWAKFLYYTGHKKTIWSQKLSEIKVYCHVARGSFHPYITKRRSEWPMECEESWVRPMRTQDGDLSSRMNYKLSRLSSLMCGGCSGGGCGVNQAKTTPRSRWPGQINSHWQGNNQTLRGNKIRGVRRDVWSGWRNNNSALEKSGWN